MAFDPNKYLQEKAGSTAEGAARGAFNPDKYLLAKTGGASAEDDEEPSALESGLRGAAQGASLGFADELTGGAEALKDEILGKAGKKSFSDLYKQHRDESRRAYQAAKDAHSTLYGVGNVAGGLATAIPLAAATGGTSLGALAAQGAVLGGAQGLGESTELTGAGDVKEALKGAAMGGLAGAAGGLASKGLAGAAAKYAPAASEKLDEVAAAQGRRALTGGANPLQVQKALTDAQVLKAIDTGGLKAGDTTARAAERLDSLRQTAGQKYADIVKGLEGAGVTGPEAGTLAQQLSDTGARIGESSIGTGVPELYQGVAEELATKPVDAAGRLSLSRAEDIKRSLQDAARAEYKKVGGNTMLGEGRMGAASQFKDSIENEIAAQAESAPEGSSVKDFANQFAPAKKDVGDYIALSEAADKGAVQAARRRAFSMSDNMMGAAAISGGLASGNPLPIVKGVGAMVGNNLLRNRGTSAIAVGARTLSKTIGRVGALAASNPAALGKYGAPLASALQRGKDSFNSAHFVLSQSDPEYQKRLKDLDDSGAMSDEGP